MPSPTQFLKSAKAIWRKLSRKVRVIITLFVIAGFLLVIGGTTGAVFWMWRINKLVASDPEKAKLMAPIVTQSYGELERQKLDIYRPKEANAAPVLFFIHGGAWEHGNKEMLYFIGESFAAEGMVTVIPNYRLYPEVKFPDFMDDPALAVKWVNQNIVNFGGDPENIFVAGHSAGGHIASLLGTDQTYLSDSSESPPEWLRGVISLAGVVDSPIALLGSARPVFKGASREEAMPISFVDSSDPPFFLAQGDLDFLVYSGQARSFEAALNASGVDVVTSYKKFADHGEVLFQFSGRTRQTDIFNSALKFIRERTLK